jgi:hypothetical protein
MAPGKMFIKTKLQLSQIKEYNPPSKGTAATADSFSPHGSTSSTEPYSASFERTHSTDQNDETISGIGRRTLRPNAIEPRRDLPKADLSRAGTEKINNLKTGPVDVDEVSLSSEEEFASPRRTPLRLNSLDSKLDNTATEHNKDVKSKYGGRFLKKAGAILKSGTLQNKQEQEDDQQTVHTCEAICTETGYQATNKSTLNSLTSDNLSRYQTLIQRRQQVASPDISMLPLTGEANSPEAASSQKQNNGTKERYSAQQRAQVKGGHVRHHKTQKSNVLLDRWRHESAIEMAKSWDAGAGDAASKQKGGCGQRNKTALTPNNPSVFIPVTVADSSNTNGTNALTANNLHKKNSPNRESPHRTYSADEYTNKHRQAGSKTTVPKRGKRIDRAEAKPDSASSNLSMRPLESRSMKDAFGSRPNKGNMPPFGQNSREIRVCHSEPFSLNECSSESSDYGADDWVAFAPDPIFEDSPTGTEVIPFVDRRAAEC